MGYNQTKMANIRLKLAGIRLNYLQKILLRVKIDLIGKNQLIMVKIDHLGQNQPIKLEIDLIGHNWSIKVKIELKGQNRLIQVKIDISLGIFNMTQKIVKN